MAALNGTRVLVTGARGAIGAGVAKTLRARGARVVGLDLVGDDDNDVLACDITDDEAVRAAVAEAIARLGGLDVLVNNAGIGDAHDAGAAPDDRARRIFEVNYWGAWRVGAAAMPALLASRGRVVNVASGLAVANVPLAGAYMSSKRAIAAWSDALRIEYGSRLGAVTTVYPSYIRTPIHDDAAKQGVGLEGLVPAEPLAFVVRTIVRCCSGRPRRDVGSSPAMTSALWFSRAFPALSDRVVVASTRRAVRRGKFAGSDIAAQVRETMGGQPAPAGTMPAVVEEIAVP